MEFSHLSGSGDIRMVDISQKKRTHRKAVAQGFISMQAATVQQIVNADIAKGNVLSAAKIAGIQAAKKTADLIPLCHNIDLTWIDIEFNQQKEGFLITTTVQAEYTTGVEMEALTAAAVSALTIYDMCKAVDKSIMIKDIKLLKKTGGKSG